MENVTITIFVSPDSLHIFSQILEILKDLELENDYVFNPSDVNFSEAMISNYVWLNVPIELYLKFKYCYNKLKNK